jgi:predicted alpha/beta superfamily hydrolase
MKQTKRTKRKKVPKSKGKKIKHRKQRGGSGDTFRRYLETSLKPIADAAVKIVKKLRQ